LGTDLADVPSFPGSGVGESEANEDDEKPNEQDPAIWKAEAAKLAALKRSVVWRSPSMHETTGEEALVKRVVTDASALTDVVPAEADTKEEPAVKIKGGRERGLVIHKLLEEVLTGETKDEAKELEERARTLLRELGVAEAKSANVGAHGPEIASSVLRTLHLDEIKALRSRLVAEVTVFSAHVEDATTTYVGGVADALALTVEGTIDAVVDWKSDVDPDSATLDLYRAQVRDYLRAAGAKSGLIVFVTNGRVENIS